MAETLKLVGKMGGTRVMEGGGGAGGVIEDRGSGTSRLAPPWRGFKESSRSSLVRFQGVVSLLLGEVSRSRLPPPWRGFKESSPSS